MWVLPSGGACGVEKVPEGALGSALHAILLAISHRIAFDIKRYESRVDLKVVPPVRPLAISLLDFGRGAELIDRARVHTDDWLAQGMPTDEQAQLLSLRSH